MKTIDNDVIHEQLFKNKPLLAYDEKNDYIEWNWTQLPKTRAI